MRRLSGCLACIWRVSGGDGMGWKRMLCLRLMSIDNGMRNNQIWKEIINSNRAPSKISFLPSAACMMRSSTPVVAHSIKAQIFVWSETTLKYHWAHKDFLTLSTQWLHNANYGMMNSPTCKCFHFLSYCHRDDHLFWLSVFATDTDLGMSNFPDYFIPRSWLL